MILNGADVKVLIVEDDVPFAEVLTEILTASGYSVVHSVKPSEALIKLKNQKFDLVLLDLQLHGYSGLRVIDGMRNPSSPDKLNAGTPIILMSGQLDPEVIKASAGKVQAVLVKPFEMNTIISKIAELTLKFAA